MSAKSILRFLIGLFIALTLFSFLLPAAGIPRAQMIPPPFVYTNAKGKATGYVTKIYARGTADPLGVAEGKQDYLVDYQFRAPAWVGLGAPKGDGKNTLYKATVGVKQGTYESVKVGQQVPVKYEVTYPHINGINLPGFGRSHVDGSAIVSGWLLWFGAAVLVGYMLAPLIQRIALREDY